MIAKQLNTSLIRHSATEVPVENDKKGKKYTGFMSPFCLICLTLQLSQCQDRMLELERLLENPNDPDRVRFLEGRDLPPAQLHSKLEEVSKVKTRSTHCLYIHRGGVGFLLLFFFVISFYLFKVCLMRLIFRQKVPELIMFLWPPK